MVVVRSTPFTSGKFKKENVDSTKENTLLIEVVCVRENTLSMWVVVFVWVVMMMMMMMMMVMMMMMMVMIVFAHGLAYQTATNNTASAVIARRSGERRDMP